MNPASSAIAKRQFLSVAIADAAMLHAAAMPFIVDGGLFVPTVDAYRLGDEVLVMLQLPGDEAATPVAAKVVWITPPGNRRGSAPGIGIQFQDASDALRARLDEVREGQQSLGEAETYTM